MSFALDGSAYARHVPRRRLAAEPRAADERCRWPWLILVPRREGAVELIDLEPAGQIQLIDEAGRAARFLKGYAQADKINLGALGAIVRQLHLHIVARIIGDPAWPAGLGAGEATPYDDKAARALIAAARALGCRRRSIQKNRVMIRRYGA